MVEMTAACCSGKPKNIGIAISTIPTYSTKNLEIAAQIKAMIYAACLCLIFRFPIMCHSKTSVMLPATIKGIKLQRGPIPISFAITGETAATDNPDAMPEVITDTTSNRLTTDPVTMVFPNGAVAACNTTNKATKTAVRVIQRILLLMFNFSPAPLLLLFDHQAVLARLLE